MKSEFMSNNVHN